MSLATPFGSLWKYVLAAILGFTVFAFGVGFLGAVWLAGRLGLNLERASYELLGHLALAATDPAARDRAKLFLNVLLVLLTVGSLAIPLLLSRLLFRRGRYVLVTLVSAIAIGAFAFAQAAYLGSPAGLRDFEERYERHQASVEIDTLTYELAERLPFKPLPLYGDGYAKLRLFVVLDIAEPGETRVNAKFVGHQTARDIQKSKTLWLDRGKRRIEFEFVTKDFTYIPSIWVEPGTNPNIHPSWLEGWECGANVEIQRRVPRTRAWEEELWEPVDYREFVLVGFEEHDVPGVVP